MITEIRKGLNVKRFHTTVRIQEETVGHHSANVAAILLRLEPDCSRDVLVAALMHDVDEVYTGDVPAPFKWDNPDAKHALAVGGMDYVDKHDIPYPHLSEHDANLLKLADMADLVLSSLEELNRGNRYAKELITNGQNFIKKMYLDSKVTDQHIAALGTMVYEIKKEGRQDVEE